MRTTDDEHRTTRVVADEGFLAIGIDPLLVKTVVDIRELGKEALQAKQPTPRSGTM